MSKFKCDICNGDILMQANKTGVCSKCGMSYDIEAIRAMVSAESEQPKESYQSTENIKKDIIDRDSLLIYLNDLRIMESIVIESKSKIDSIQFLRNELQDDVEYKKKMSISEPIVNTQNTGVEYLLGLWGVIFIVFGLLFFLNGSFYTPARKVSLIIGLCFLIYAIINIKRKEAINKVEKNKAMEKHREKVKNHEDRIKALDKECQEYQRKSSKTTNKIQNDINEITKLLQKAYSANIIPLQFRNIQGVYYLYDYLSTSNQTLSEALMQCNLEAIKEKLDNVIKLQSKSIIQQAQANAEIMAQNERILSAAQATMQNTAEAAKYAQISAVNSALSLKLQSKSLAYQKADYWLK